MTSPIKKIELICYGAIAVDKDAREGWSDVWVRYHDGRKRVSFGPTLISRADFEWDIKFNREFAEEHPEFRDETLAEIAVDEKLLARLDTDSIVIERLEDGCPNIYTAKRYIDHGEAEAMIKAFLIAKGLKRFKLKWMKPKVLCCPFSFAQLGEA